MTPRIAAILFMSSLALADDDFAWRQLPPLPNAIGVAAPFAGTTDGSLLVAGGANFPGKMPWEGGKKVWHDNVWLLDRPEGVWREIGKLPRPLGYGVCVTHRESVICIGGSDAERHYADSFRLTWKEGKLQVESLPSLPIPLSGASGALMNDTVFVACGAEQPGEQAATDRAFALKLSASKPTWRELPPLPGKPRMLAAGSAHGDAFYVIGGVALEANNEGKIARVYLREAWRYKDGQGWQRIADLPKPSVAAASPAPVMAGRLLLLGGDDGSRVGFQPLDRHPGFPDALFAYDLARNVWSEAGKVPAPRATVPCVQWNDSYVLPSGESRPGVRSPEAWSITPRQ